MQVLLRRAIQRTLAFPFNRLRYIHFKFVLIIQHSFWHASVPYYVHDATVFAPCTSPFWRNMTCFFNQYSAMDSDVPHLFKQVHLIDVQAHCTGGSPEQGASLSCLGRISTAVMDTEGQRTGKPRRRQRHSGARAAATAYAAPATLGPRPSGTALPHFQQQANMSSTTKESLTEATFASFQLSDATLRCAP